MSHEKEVFEALFARIARGDADAFERLVTLTEKQIYNTSLSILKNREDAEDVVQETYLRLWRGASSYRGGSPIAFLYTTARNLSIDKLRECNRHPTQSEDENALASVPDTSPTPEEYVIRKLEAETVRISLSELPDEYREIITLRDIDGLTYDEIAQILSIPEGTVKSRLSRARDRLREILLKKNIF